MKQKAHAMSRRQAIKAIGALLALVLVCTGVYAVGRRLEVSQYGDQTVRGDLSMHDDDLWLVTYEGTEYAYNERLTTVLFMGVDTGSTRPGKTTGFRNGGQADFLMLLVLDPEQKTIRRIQIDRDTMTEITVLGVLGNDAGTKTAQIALSHGFGDGKKQSCQFTCDAVSKLLCGALVDFYVALDMDSIAILNDLVGGVSVLLEDDYSAHDPTMTKGATVTLMGEKAEMFVRWRTAVGDGTNASRMRRQSTYLTAFTESLSERIAEDRHFIGTLYDALGEHLLTNMSRGRMINTADSAAGYALDPTLSIDGEHRIGIDGFMEFHADPKNLERLVIDTFFKARR